MSVIARRVRAIPYRSASEAWRVIVDLVAPEGSTDARQELLGIVGVVSSLIMDETLKDAACVVWGAGPRLRVYCLYAGEAISGENANEESLQFCPTGSGWQMSLPCHPEDIAWIQAALKKRGSHVSVRNVNGAVPDDAGEEKSKSTFTIDQEAFLRP